eukprot:TRINITY_DN8630_c0_g1_i1.p1 TRINITY_DN8630_c0_g1~~TRINITY_DN8630_c0_g1_i1.p1  ORF type:complete len:275 (+),score=39.70 TRINITY_DN8630_c0_g1_i1:102-926(+)
MREFRRKVRSNDRVGFAPTMGALHSGHMSLLRHAKQDCNVVGTSIFVNPTQFGPNEDFDRYPRTFEADCKLLENEGVDFVFTPTRQEMFPNTHRTFVNLDKIDETAREGRARPGFFRGVSTVCTKLFNIVQPHGVYFGQKDGMQSIVIRSIVRDLNMPIAVNICPTERADDGLALSSRNAYLSEKERSIAPIVYRSLVTAEKIYGSGVIEANLLKKASEEVLQSQSDIKLDYLDLCDLDTGKEIASVGNAGAMLSVAVWLGKTRLIDNILLRPR